ncbi:unnamed protein product, partial [Anisakis simplex]|uniref:Ntox16 domain-containing protein n=1 Tax=Anisakis simplex TaxID=6269 RepID=A0A0M3KJP1_ANISI
MNGRKWGQITGEDQKKAAADYTKRLNDCIKEGTVTAECLQPPAFCGKYEKRMVEYNGCVVL